ncbi:hypothetical protein Tsubulata_049945 [Turnera subulata]|uniref:Tudor domain-containing protein n=1 Tax=Turnera subulata TaxID=218843 RepID=A0A9Q0JNE0_9ROSI|nr:hypothetical protein Tsubulata_049945 [Turnera subulata]
MALTDKELEQQLVEAGNKLLDPPSSGDALLQLLDQVESCLSKVEQSPSESMHSALAPSLKALIEDRLFKHSNADVRVAVASCISEITRITAPDAPYEDDQMKDVFQLIVSSFENLADNSSRSYGKRTSILETVAKVRSCVVMLDLECDELIIEMFQHFLKAIRDNHPATVFSSMETIMSLVLEESEDISEELLYPLLATLKKDNEALPVAQKLGEKVLENSSTKEVLPVARRLAEKVIESCAAKVKPYLINAVRSLGIPLNKYSDIVASICEIEEDDVHENNVSAADENKIDENKPVEASAEEASKAVKEEEAEASSPKHADPVTDASPMLVPSNGVAQGGEDDSLGASNSSKKEAGGTEQSKDIVPPNNDQTSTVDAEKVVNAESKPEEPVNAESKPEEPVEVKETKVNSTEVAEPPESSEVDSETLAEKVPDDKALSKDIPSSPQKQLAIEADSSENKNKSVSQPSSPKAVSHPSSPKTVSPPSSPKAVSPPSSPKAVSPPSSPKAVSPSSSPRAVSPTSSPKAVSPTSSPKTVSQPSSAKTVSEPSSPKTVSQPSSPKAVSQPSSPKAVRQPSSPKVLDGESVSVTSPSASPSVSGSLPDETRSKAGRSKKKDSLVKDPVPSADEVPQKASDGTSDSETKQPKRSGKKPPPGDSAEDKIRLTVSKKENSTASESEVKPLKSKKMDGSSKKEDGSSLQQSEEKGRRSRGKSTSDKNATKSVTKVNEKVKLTSPKSASKSATDELDLEETPLTSAKRKRTPGKEKVSDAKEYGENVVGAKVKVWWPKDRQYYEGVIDSFDPVKKKHKVLYVDGDEETLNLKREKMQFIQDDSEPDEAEDFDRSSADTSDVPLKKKMKTNSDRSTKQGKTDDSSLKKSGGTSASKSRSVAPQSGQKSKSVSKTDGKSVGDMKAVKKTEEESGAKAKNRTPKSGIKSADVASKATNKSRNDESSTSKASRSKDEGIGTPKTSNKSKLEIAKTGKAKQDNSPKVVSNSKGKTNRSASKSDVNGTGKMKSSTPKVKDIEDEENSTDSEKVHESGKRKLAASSKGQGSDVKSGKKRRRGA